MCLSLKVKVIESQVGQVKGHRSKSALLTLYHFLFAVCICTMDFHIINQLQNEAIFIKRITM